MDEVAARIPLVTEGAEADLEREFAQRLAESSALAFRVAYGVLRNREDAEEAAQEAFARAYTQFRSLRDREAFRAWLVRITWRLAIDHQRMSRRRQQREQVSIESATPAPTAEDLAVQQQMHERLWAAVDALPDAQRSVVILAAIQGYDTREVAGLLELPEGTVKSRLFAARKRLAESLRCLVNDTKKG
jgi:RNA polymerase sigma-70 factor, ECF subfamily